MRHVSLRGMPSFGRYGEKTDLEQRVPVMLLVVMHERHSRLVILLALLVAELANVSPSLARLAAIPRLDDLRAGAKRAESAPARHERRVLVGQQPAHDRTAVLRLSVPARGCAGEGLGVVAAHAAVADAVARWEDELEVRVAKGDLALRYVLVLVLVRLSVLFVFVFVLGRGGWRLVDHLVDPATRVIVPLPLLLIAIIDVFPALRGLRSLLRPLPLRPPFRLLPLPLFGIRIRRRKVVIVGHFEHRPLGLVRDLAVALVEHVFADRVERAELAPLAVAIDAHVAHRDLLAEVGDESRDVDEVFRVRDEKGVLDRHVREVIFQ